MVGKKTVFPHATSSFEFTAFTPYFGGSICRYGTAYHCPGRGVAWRGGDPGRTATSAPPIGWRAARSPPAAPVHEARALVEPSGREGEEASHPYGDPDAAVVLHLWEPAALHRTLHLYGAGHVTCCPWSRIPRYGCTNKCAVMCRLIDGPHEIGQRAHGLIGRASSAAKAAQMKD